MFFLGILAVFQILFFPGLIFRALYHPRGKFFFQLSVVIAISMLFNFLIFYAMILLHIYTRTAVLIIIGLEILALLWLYRSIFSTSLDDLAHSIRDEIDKVKQSFQSWFSIENSSPAITVLRGLVIVVFLVLALSLTYWFFRRLPNNFGSVFNSWDSVVSWNAWAETWAQGQTPRIHLTYPQLLPINLSVTYVLIGNTHIDLFAKAIMPLFALLIVLTLLEMAHGEKKYGYLIAVVIFYLLCKKFLLEYLTEGYTDLPVAFMGWIAMIPFIRNKDILADKKEFILGMIITAAASLTKQVGLYLLLILPVISYINTKNKSRKQFWFCLIVLVLAGLVTFTWYLPLGIDILQGNQSLGIDRYVNHANNVLDTTSLWLRPVYAMLTLGKYLAVFAFSAVAAIFLDRRWRLIILFYIIPFTLLWGIIASYSERNLAMVFPFWAAASGLGIAFCLDWGWGLLSKIKTGKLGTVFLILLVLAPFVYFGLKLDDDTLTAKWRDTKSQIFSPSINEQLYALDYSKPGCKTILTNYPVAFLPGLEDRQITFLYTDYGMYLKYIADPSICWMLVPGNFALDEVKQDIDAKLANGTYTLIYDEDQWVPYQLIQIR
jgi:hypothetical protein